MKNKPVFLNKKEDGTTKKINEMNNRIRENIKKKKHSDNKDNKRKKKDRKNSDCRIF